MSSNFKEQLKELLDSMDLTAEAGYSGECLSDEEVLSLAYERGDARTEHLAECQECSERLNFAKTQARLYERYKKAFLSEARGRSEKPVGLAYAFRPFWDALPRSKSWFAVPVLAFLLAISGPILHSVFSPPEPNPAFVEALKKIAGTPDPQDAQAQAQDLLSAASQGKHIDPSSLGRVRSEVQKKAGSANANVNLRREWLRVDNKLAGAEILSRYEDLASSKKQVPLEQLGITNVWVQDGVAEITAGAPYIENPDIQLLLSESVGKTNGVSGLDLKGPNGFSKSLVTK